MRAALLQMTSGIDPAANARTLVDAVARAAAGGAAMLFTPEMSGLLDGDRDRAAGSLAREEDDRVLASVREAAARHGVWVHLGRLAIVRPDGRLANRGFVIDGSGAIRARYDKMHLFDVDLASGECWRESDRYAAGEGAALVDTPLGMLGLAICYDLRFPDLFRALSEAGATVFAVPAAAQTGEHADGRATFGHSLAVDPWGEVLLDMGEDAGLAFAEMDPERQREARARVPVLRHRRAIGPVAAS